MRSTSSPDSTTTSDPIVNSLMQELRSMKITATTIDACSKSGDSGFLSSGDSSVNGDACSSNASVIMRVNSGSSTSIWGNKTIWGATPTTLGTSIIDNNNFNFSSINNSKESIWSTTQSPPLSGNNNNHSLWENNNKQLNTNNNENNNNNKNQDAEWLGSIWMIPQTPQTNNNINANNTKISSYSSKLNAIWDTPDTYQNFKADLQQQQTTPVTSEFQLLRPHDIGRNMWNNSTAAAVMSGVTKQESVSSIWAAPSPVPTPAPLPKMPQRVNPVACIAPKNYINNNTFNSTIAMQQQQQHITNTSNNGIIAGNHQQMSMQQNNCYSQLFSDDFLNNYLNMIN